ncbi:MAG TPA: XdhC family protein [Planctomycetaceae bacterium]|nr:XdhC family protein [Planctomycetaceae bacterium]
MREVLKDLEEAIRDRRPVSYTALVETRGSTPQKPGATMLVFPDGSQTGTLGGGCVEAEVKRRSLRLLEAGQPEIVTFQLDDDYGWDDGLICGGRMKMLVDPIRPGEDAGYYHALLERVVDGRGFTEAVVLDQPASDGRVAADRWLLDERGAVVAERRVGRLPAELLANLRPISERPRPYVLAGVSYLPRLSRVRLVIVGGGHVGLKVAEIARDADFDIWVVDDRETYCNSERFPWAQKLVAGPIESSLRQLDVNENTFCIIVTRGHQHDEEALFALINSPAAFIGMIGSRRKIRLIFDDLLREGISSETLKRVHAPLGLDIGSQTVPEIAVSIVAELIAQRNLGRNPYPRHSVVEERESHSAGQNTSEKISHVEPA